MIGVKKPEDFLRLTKEAKADLSTWFYFLAAFKGKVIFLENVMPAHRVGLYTDASGSIGFGAVMGNAWFQGRWSEWWLKQNITLLELYPITVALETWGCLLKNKILTLHIDNKALVHVLTFQSSREPLVMILVRRLVLCCLRYNIVLHACHIAGSMNIKADALSHFQMERFWAAAPQANKIPSIIPELPLTL